MSIASGPSCGVRVDLEKELISYSSPFLMLDIDSANNIGSMFELLNIYFEFGCLALRFEVGFFKFIRDFF